MNYFLTIVFAFISMLALHGQGNVEPYAEVSLISAHLVPGEQTGLLISLRKAQTDSRPAAPIVPNTAVNFVRAFTQIDTQRQLSQVFLYRLTPAKPGKYTIPPVTMSSGGQEYASSPVTFEVHDPAKLTSVPAGQSGHKVLTGWFPAKTTLYQGEQCPLILKIYVPEQLRLASWGLPESEKENCLAWRFSPPSMNELGRASIGNIPHLCARYTTTLSGISPGTATLGPSKLRIIARQRTIDPRFGPRISDKPISLTLPALDFNILPLPAEAPSDFKGAVGQFQIGRACSKTSLNDTDSAEITLQVSGTGNLENIQPPTLTGEGWKVIDTSKVTRGHERRLVSGVVTFRQLLRPDHSTQLPSAIPPHSFSFFDPDKKSYHTLTTPAIPVNITRTLSPGNGTAPHSGNPVETLGTPPEKMRGILGFIAKPSTDKSPTTHHLSIYWHLLPALICLTIISIPVLRKIKAATSRTPDEQRKQNALKKLTDPTDTKTFYRRAGRFIDQWLSPDDELNTILSERDEICFLPSDTEPSPVTDQRKNEIITLLKHCSKLSLILLLATLTTPNIKAAENLPPTTADAAWQEGNYQQTIKLYLKQYPKPSDTPADILYNIGNCHHRLDQPGHAALAWRRALARQPNHPKARQNLRFVEFKEGSITPKLDSWQQHLTRLPLQVFRGGLHTSLWLLLITILMLTLIRPKRTTGLIILTFLAPITATISALGISYYPDTNNHTPFDKQAVCLTKTSLYSQAHRQDNSPATLPPASLVTITAARGPWIHILSPDDQSGWVDSRSISPVLPTKDKQ